MSKIQEKTGAIVNLSINNHDQSLSEYHPNPTYMKNAIMGLSLILISIGVAGQSKHDDSLAVLIIDRMADVISDLESCSFKLNAATDINEHGSGIIKHLTDYEVYMSGPNKMLVNVHGYKGHRQLMYNGKRVAYYSFDEHNYGVLQAPETTIKAIDQLHTEYGIEFPAADFFYPAFTDDLLEHSDSLRFMGLLRMEGKEYFQVVAFCKEVIIQFWIHNDAYNLPAKFAIIYKNQPGNPQYTATFSEWQINPVLPVSMFDFLPPPGAAKVRVMAKTGR